jgi:hypothetical protein
MGPVHAAAGRRDASALFAQIAAAGAALEKLSDCLDVMAGRGEITIPDYDGAGEAERLCTAQTVLGAAGQEAFGAIGTRDCDEAVDILAIDHLHRSVARRHPRDVRPAGRPAG